MRAYYFLGWLLKPILTTGFFLYCIITRTPRVRLVVRNQDDQILLVKSWSSRDQWSLPGGGVDKGETPEMAAVRELSEEAGLEAKTNSLQHILTRRDWGHEEIVFATTVTDGDLPDTLPHPYEIKEAAWFDESDLPKLGRLARRIMPEIVASED